MSGNQRSAIGRPMAPPVVLPCGAGDPTRRGKQETTRRRSVPGPSAPLALLPCARVRCDDPLDLVADVVAVATFAGGGLRFRLGCGEVVAVVLVGRWGAVFDEDVD